ncbi:hypothetical protein HII36_52675 [Nonomuraea sp. NN258]|uniref:hypothetical protein n=1 Tax=Nonomuraea antri TaxID=2730852 RepID=UPI001567F8C8|nr:hypothetical protein [Nonomuraea antri]NRQ40418.1 hypothetical protein [Nonomuraea antri]
MNSRAACPARPGGYFHIAWFSGRALYDLVFILGVHGMVRMSRSPSALKIS